MKMKVFAFIALLLAGSVTGVANASTFNAVGGSNPTPQGKKGPVVDSIPPPTCPPSDPNGCGIYCGVVPDSCLHSTTTVENLYLSKL